MTATRELIFEAVDTAIAAIALAPFVSRMAKGDPSHFPAINVVDGGQRVTEEEAQVTRYTLDLQIEGFVEDSGDAASHAALNELHAQVVEALRTEPLLGGLAEELLEGELMVDVAQLASEDRLAFIQNFIVVFATPAGRPVTD